MVAAFLGVQNYVNRELLQPTPTYMASAVAIKPSFTATATPLNLPDTRTPAPTKSEALEQQQTSSPTGTSAPGSTPTTSVLPSPTPTSKPQLNHTFAITILDQTVNGELVPTPVPTLDVPSGITNTMLLGSDIDLNQGIGRTDTIIIVSINQNGPTASMMSLPRDLYVYIPGWTMGRINTALSRGSSSGYPGGSIALLKDTILYNFGVPIHYYAQIDFEGFKQVVDLMDGVDVAVSCQVRDIWQLKLPSLDPSKLENWDWHTLERGVYTMDGDLALWYARSRRTSSDFDRGRRQQQLLRIMLNQAVDLNLLAEAPSLWNTYRETVRTDLDIGRMLQLGAYAPAVRANGIQHLYLVGDQLEPYIVPESGAQVQQPVWENMQYSFQRLFLPPALNRAARPPITVEVLNGTDNPDLPILAADNLAWYGFEPVISLEKIDEQSSTTIEYHGQNLKGSFDWLLSWIVDKEVEDVELVSDEASDFNYQVVLGADYDPCRPQLFAPQAFIAE
jgi:LCP family protein required for cell wall assembly